MFFFAIGRVILLMSAREFLARERALTVSWRNTIIFLKLHDAEEEAISSMRGSSDTVTADK